VIRGDFAGWPDVLPRAWLIAILGADL